VPRLGRKRSAVEKLADAFRSLPVPVVGRIQDGALILDLRCLEDEAGFLEQLAQLSIPAPAAAPPAGAPSENTSP
jgi:L-seryl-tRNA(Ser) seleniumtransferase